MFDGSVIARCTYRIDLYLFLDIFSRKIVGFDVFDEQSAEHASDVVSAAYMTENVRADEVTLHADNGGPMKGSIMLATLQNLGVTTSFSRPSVSNGTIACYQDNKNAQVIFLHFIINHSPHPLPRFQ
jgi:transposase InsO family protein